MDIEKVIKEIGGVKEVVVVEYPNIAFGFVPAAAIVKSDPSLTEMKVQNYVKGKKHSNALKFQIQINI